MLADLLRRRRIMVGYRAPKLRSLAAYDDCRLHYVLVSTCGKLAFVLVLLSFVL